MMERSLTRGDSGHGDNPPQRPPVQGSTLGRQTPVVQDHILNNPRARNQGDAFHRLSISEGSKPDAAVYNPDADDRPGHARGTPLHSTPSFSVVIDLTSPSKVTFEGSKAKSALASMFSPGDLRHAPVSDLSHPIANSAPSTNIATTANGKKRGRPFARSKTPPTTDAGTKKKGRPFQHASDGTLLAPGDVPASKPRPSRAGAKRSYVAPKPRIVVERTPTPKPEFVPFLCEWKYCTAELQNLETLRAHIFMVHGTKIGDSIPCLWAKCGKIELSAAETSDQSFFPTREQWQNHVNRAHLVPFSWHMGDGPKGTSLGIPPLPTHKYIHANIP